MPRERSVDIDTPEDYQKLNEFLCNNLPPNFQGNKMKIGPSPDIDLSRFNKPENELEVFYGLPRDVQFCKKCNMSNQQPMSSNEYAHNKESKKTTMSFDEHGVCHACNFNALKETGEIDWDERERELLDLCNQYRKTDGSYDCIVGGSGGKDSAMQSHLLKYKYGMHPLTVTWSPHLYTEIGWKNFQDWLHVGGFDNFLYKPERENPSSIDAKRNAQPLTSLPAFYPGTEDLCCENGSKV